LYDAKSLAVGCPGESYLGIAGGGNQAGGSSGGGYTCLVWNTGKIQLGYQNGEKEE